MSTAPGHKVFVYGSLMSKNVLDILLGSSRAPSVDAGTAVRAHLPGFHRYQVKTQVYPAILRSASPENVVEGMVLHGINDAELQLLDEFEDVEYNREVVQVQQQPDGSTAEVFAYVWRESHKDELHGTWSFEDHFLPHEQLFCNSCAEFIKVYQSSE